jgi:DNA-binding NarL/FixJ family response regulator
MIKVAIIDDNPAIVFGLKSAIQKNEEITLAFASTDVADFLVKLDEIEVDVLVVDLVIDDVISPNFLAELHKNYPDKKIIAYSNAQGESIDLFLSRVGVTQLINKKESMETLLSCIIQVSHGAKSKPNKKAIIFSEKELEVISLLGKGFSSSEIAEHLDISPNTVNFHKKKLLKKFEVSSISELIRDAVELGICRD